MPDISQFTDRTIGVQRATITSDSSAASTRSWLTVASGVAAASAPMRDSVINAYAQRQMVVDTAFYIDTTTLNAALVGGIKLNDRIVDSGTNYVVLGVKPWSNAGTGISGFYEVHTQRQGL